MARQHRKAILQTAIQPGPEPRGSFAQKSGREALEEN
jgi:hypothetical protein